jgi:hypothetical protein
MVKRKKREATMVNSSEVLSLPKNETCLAIFDPPISRCGA